MSFNHGSRAVLKINDASSSLTDVSAYLSSAGLSNVADVAEVSTLNSTAKQYIGGLKDGSFPLEGNFEPTADALLSGVLGGSADGFEYYPAGTATGMPKYTGNGFLVSYEITTPVDDAAKFSAEYQVTGGITRGTVAP